MSNDRTKNLTSCNQARRAFAMVCLLLVYMFVGVQHLAHDVVVTSGAAVVVVSDASGESAADQNGKWSGIAHHCGEFCFSVMMPDPIRTFAKSEPKTASHPQLQLHLSGLAPDNDTPPPKNLI